MLKDNYKRLHKTLYRLLRDKYFLMAFVVIICGAFLRFYRVPEFMTFLGDQGRDAIIIKRILTGEHFPAIGAPTSYGQVYLGPFYYYFIAPWLLLFRFQPMGLAYGVGFFSIVYLIVNYFAIKDIFDKKVALLSTILITFSITMIDLSRFSWNPNLLPFATLITIYSVIKAIKTQRAIFFISSGVFLSIAIQLHYLSLFLIPGIALVFLWELFKQKKLNRPLFSKYSIFFTAFLLFSSPLIIFDLRHQFLNTHNFITLFTQSAQGQTNKLATFLQSFYDLNTFTLNIDLSIFISIIILLIIVSYCYIEFRTTSQKKVFLFIFICNLLAFSLYNRPRFPHYFGTLYPFYYVLFAAIFNKFFTNKLGSKTALLIVGIMAFLYIVINAKSYYFIKGKASNQVAHAEIIAKAIYKDVRSNTYRLTSLPERYSDTTYRYFLELWGRRPVEKDSIDKTNELFVVCDARCKPIGDPQYDIALFAPTRVEKQFSTVGVTIYKLTNKP